MAGLPDNWREKYGSWAVITGASDGIGREMAVSVAKAGLNVVLVARRRAVLDALASELAQHYNIETCVIDADLAQDGGVNMVIAATQALDVGLLVACAGFGTAGSFLQTDIDQQLNMLDVNSGAVLALTHHFAQRFAQRGRGGIVLMSSLVAFQGVPMSANYAATKAYVQSLAEALHIELKPLGVDVVASAPGPIHSGFAARANMQMGLALPPDSVAEATLKALGRRMTVRPGWLSKFLEASLVALPRGGRVRIMKQVMNGMTQHQT